jgi:hypothetical protein
MCLITTIGVGVGVGVGEGVAVEVGAGVPVGVGVLVTIGGGATVLAKAKGVAAGVVTGPEAPCWPSLKAIIPTAATRMIKGIVRITSNFI